MNIFNRFTKVVNKLFKADTIEEALDIEVADEDITKRQIKTWRDIYQNRPPWEVEESLNLGSTIASEVARLVTLEISSEITGSSEHIEGLNKIYQDKVIDSIKTTTEYAAALGGIVLKPYISEGDIAVSRYMADEFIPVKFNSNGSLVAAVFPDTIKRDGYEYTKLEWHDLIGQNVIIKNLCFKKKEGEEGLGSPTALEMVDEWAELEGEVVLDTDQPLFTYFKMPLANQEDMDSNLGVSVYSRAIGQLKRADKQWENINYEYDYSRKKIFIAEDIIKRDPITLEPVEVPDVISMLDIGIGENGNAFYQEYNPSIRNEQLFSGLEEIKRAIEYNCHLSYGSLSRVDEVARTATEIKMSRQRSYATIADTQKALEVALRELIDAMAYWYGILNKVKLGDYEVSFHFDDSLVVDNETEQKTYLLEVQAGIRTIESYLKEMYDLTDEQIEEVKPRTEVVEDYDDFE